MSLDLNKLFLAIKETEGLHDVVIRSSASFELVYKGEKKFTSRNDAAASVKSFLISRFLSVSRQVDFLTADRIDLLVERLEESGFVNSGNCHRLQSAK